MRTERALLKKIELVCGGARTRTKMITVFFFYSKEFIEW